MKPLLGVLCAWLLSLHVTGPSTAPQDPQRPTFRTGVNLVRVDAYPARDGKIIEGLTAADFEIFEDGVAQKIETFQFVQFPQNTPAEERRDPNSQREGFQLAADPTYRVFVIYLDNLHVEFGSSAHARRPLITFLNRVLGPKDLFGVLTTLQRPEDLMLGQQTLVIEEQLNKYWDWGTGSSVREPEEDLMLQVCFPREVARALIARRRVDEVFADLEGLATMLSSMREERKNVLLVSNGWVLPGPFPELQVGVNPRIPKVGVSDKGQLTAGSRSGEVERRWCDSEMQRLSTIDFQLRLRELLALARRSNVAFYAIKPGGLMASAFPEALRWERDRTDSLMTLSNNTDGIAVVNTNDLTTGAFKIADTLAGVYMLGYYPSNAASDGKLRRITVRLKGTKTAIRARREYVAPTTQEMASMRAALAPPAARAPSSADTALAELKRLRPGAVLHTLGTVLGEELILTTELTAAEVESGRWKDGGDVQIMVSAPSGEGIGTARGRLEPGSRAAVVRIPLNGAAGPFNAAVRVRNATDRDAQDAVTVARSVSLFGGPLLFRSPLPAVQKPAGSVFFRRTERMQVRWPVAAALDQREARILGRDGVPLELAVAVKDLEEGGRRFLVADLNLAPLTAGEYIIEARGSAGGRTESALLAFRVFR